MAPDFGQLLGCRREIFHRLPEATVSSAAAAIIAWIAFQTLLRRPLLSLLPRAVRLRAAPAVIRSDWRALRRWPMMLLSLTIGVASHLVIDAMTHGDSWGSAYYRALHSAPFAIAGHRMHTYFLTQVGGSVAGAAVIIAYVLRWYRNTAPGRDIAGPFSPATCAAAGPAMIAFAFAVASLLVLRSSAAISPHHPFASLPVLSKLFMRVAIIEIFAFSTVWRLVRPRDCVGSGRESLSSGSAMSRIAGD